VAIYWVNRCLPVASDALVKRMLLHVPLSIAFTVAYTYVNQSAAMLLGGPEPTPWLGANLFETIGKVHLPPGNVRVLGDRDDLRRS